MIENTNIERHAKHRRVRERGNRNFKLLYSVLAILIWGGLIYGGYTVAKNYFEDINKHIDEQINEMKQQNEAVIAQLEQFNLELQASTEELLIITNEIAVIKDALEITGETLTGSDATRLALQERISILDVRLNELTAQLKKLEEAARAH